MRDDPEVNEIILILLGFESYQRRFIINIRLEHLRQQKAFEKLQQALSYLFDDMLVAYV